MTEIFVQLVYVPGLDKGEAEDGALLLQVYFLETRDIPLPEVLEKQAACRLPAFSESGFRRSVHVQLRKTDGNNGLLLQNHAYGTVVH